MGNTKVRFDGLDVAAMVALWNREALGRRVINIYNGPNGDTYIFKLDKRGGGGGGVGGTADGGNVDSKPDGDAGGNSNSATSNLLLLLESGVRFHTSETSYENPAMPSQFCSKLRKHLRGLRLEQVTQLGMMDRVVHLVFGSGDAQRHSLILELYARGNLILTNSQYSILALLRSHEYNSAKDNSNPCDKNGTRQETVQVKVGHAYPVTYATTMAATASAATTSTASSSGIISNDEGLQEDDCIDTNGTLLTSSDPLQWWTAQTVSSHTSGEESAAKDASKKKKKDSKNTSQNAWKMLLLSSTSGVSYYGPALIEHCLRCANLWGVDKKFPTEMTADEWKDLQSILQKEGGRVLNDIRGKESKGYILYQEKARKLGDACIDTDDVATSKSPTSISSFDDKILLEFQPHLLKQHESMPRLEYKTFDRAVDTFFSHLESQKRLLRAENQQAQAEQRLEKIRLDQEQRVQALLEQQGQLQREAELVQVHADMVEKALQVVNSALDSGMDWEQLQDLVQLEKEQNRNPVAMLIHKLDLENDEMVLRLATLEGVFGDENGAGANDLEYNVENPKGFVDVTVSLNETAHGNAKALFAKYRASKEKSQKTIEASAKALAAAEETANRQLLEVQNKKSHISVQAKRKPIWFERFNWFITTDNYLVLGGRDAQQNELLVKRYLRQGDAYLHADVHGAASCVLRAKRRRDPLTGRTLSIPLSSQALREAGSFTICRSSAWTSRMVTSAWWVESHQVSKTAPTGEYLTVGSFMVRGKKNFLPPSQLEMGLAVFFRLGDDDSVRRHANERRDFALMQLEETDEDSFVDADNSSTMANKSTKLVAEEKVKQRTILSSIDEPNLENESLLPICNEDDEFSAQMPSGESCTPTLGQDGNEIGNGHVLSYGGDTESLGVDVTEVSEPNQKKKGLSVKERKLVKKYGSLEAAHAAKDQGKSQDEKEAPSEISSVLSSPMQAQPSNPGSKRGKKAKLKKMTKKYANQDDDDREMALLALHAGEKTKRESKKRIPQISEKEKVAAADTIAILKKDSVAISEQFSEPVRTSLSRCITVVDGNGESIVRWDKLDGDVLEQLLSLELEEQKLAAANRLLSLKETSRIDNFSASLAGIIRTIRKYGHEGMNKETETAQGSTNEGKRKKKNEKDDEHDSWKKTLADEGFVDADGEVEENVDDTVELSKLTGKPQQEDLLLFAVPVCAPYQSLSQYTYRVKLTPGNMKRGKAAKQCVDMFVKEHSKPTTSDPSLALIKQVSDNEWVQAICGDVKISAAGASRVMQKTKEKKKNIKKKK